MYGGFSMAMLNNQMVHVIHYDTQLLDFRTDVTSDMMLESVVDKLIRQQLHHAFTNPMLMYPYIYIYTS